MSLTAGDDGLCVADLPYDIVHQRTKYVCEVLQFMFVSSIPQNAQNITWTSTTGLTCWSSLQNHLAKDLEEHLDAMLGEHEADLLLGQPRGDGDKENSDGQSPGNDSPIPDSPGHESPSHDNGTAILHELVAFPAAKLIEVMENAIKVSTCCVRSYSDMYKNILQMHRSQGCD